MSDEKHFHISPSSLGRYEKCNASYLYKDIEERKQPTERAEFGNAAHWYAYKMLINDPVDIGDEAPNGVVISDYLHEMIMPYLNICWNLSKIADLYAVEKQLNLSSFTRDMYGTCDFYAVDYKNKIIHVYDLKTGMIQVPAEENLQLCAYARGVADEIGLDGQSAQDWKYEMCIYQPTNRTMPLSKWIITEGEIRGYWNRIKKVIDDVLEKRFVRNAGDNCVYCAGKSRCESYRQAVLKASQYRGPDLEFVQTMEEKEIEFLELESVIKLLDSRMRILKTELVQNGGTNTLEVVPSKVERVPKNEKRYLRYLKREGVDPYTHKIKSIAAAEKEVSDKKELEKHITRKVVGRKLKQKRDYINDFRRMFEDE